MDYKVKTAISKHAWELIDLAKQSTLQNVTTAVASGDLKIDRSELSKLVSLIQASIEQGYDRGINEFQTQVSIVVDTASVKKK